MAYGFVTLPDVLVVTASRFVLKNWVPTKLGITLLYKSDVDVPLVVPQEPMAFDSYIVPRGVQPRETALPEDDTSTSSALSLPPLNEAAFAQIQEMGFPAVRVEKALRMTGNESADAAMQWLFQHMDDPDIDIPYAGTSSSSGEFSIDDEKMENLMTMGFTESQARKALQETVFPILFN